MRTLTAIAALAALTGCDLLFPEDPRVGAEAPEKCAVRVMRDTDLARLDIEDGDTALYVPTYTFDITKLGLEEIQQLSRSSYDETEGARLNRATNTTATAVEIFMAEPVDENGAFFMATDPALYRVRGEPQRLADIAAAGCARQQTNMRLIAVDIVSTGTNAAPETQETETTAPQTP